MSVSVSHKGIVTAVGKDMVSVIISPSAEDCDGCAISQLCAKKETVDIYYRNPDKSLIGKCVTIEISSSSQTRAVLLMLAIPIFIIVAAMLVAVSFGISELMSALISLACVAVWYLGVYLSGRNSLKKHSVTISSIDT